MNSNIFIVENKFFKIITGLMLMKESAAYLPKEEASPKPASPKLGKVEELESGTFNPHPLIQPSNLLCKSLTHARSF